MNTAIPLVKPVVTGYGRNSTRRPSSAKPGPKCVLGRAAMAALCRSGMLLRFVHESGRAIHIESIRKTGALVQRDHRSKPGAKLASHGKKTECVAPLLGKFTQLCD